MTEYFFAINYGLIDHSIFNVIGSDITQKDVLVQYNKISFLPHAQGSGQILLSHGVGPIDSIHFNRVLDADKDD
jgi:ADP-glucose pyrophosphorylase